MSEKHAAPISTDQVVEQLFPKIIANHASKLPEFEAVPYSTILDTASNRDLPVNDRIVHLSSLVGNRAITDALVDEVAIMELCATGREDEIADESRRAEYRRSDANQQKTALSRRSLDFYMQNGIEVIFDQEGREAAHRYCDLDNRRVPLIEKLKAKRLFTINGFQDSRVMYAVHDLIDHAWLFNTLRDNGMFDRYSDFLSSIDMGEEAFLYSRQAELLASVGFGARRWPVAEEQGESIVLSAPTLLSVLRMVDDPRTHSAATLLERMAPADQRQAVFIIENMAVQFADERRRWGSVKQVDSATGERHPMKLIEPLHIAMMIESLGVLQKNASYKGIQLSATLEVEKVLSDTLADANPGDTIYIPVPRAQQQQRETASSSGEWIKKHISVSTSYNHIVDKEDKE